MVITRTPFRISFFGGGTDYPSWYQAHGGVVLSTSINKYCYITTRYLPPFFDHTYRIRYTKREETKSIRNIEHPSVRECLRYVGVRQGIEMVHTSDLPAMSGLGSSSSFTVGFLHSLYALQGTMVTKRKLALDAIHVEQDRIRENVGSQDQTAAAFGGFNVITFGGHQKITVQPVTVSDDRLSDLKQCLMLFFTGYSRRASEIAAEQVQRTKHNAQQLTAMTRLVSEALELLQRPSGTLGDFGKLLHESWMLKQGLSSKISNDAINDIYTAGRRAGAAGGKLLGAGGGGFMMFFVEPRLQKKVRTALKKLLYVPFDFEHLGSQIIYYAPPSIV